MFERFPGSIDVCVIATGQATNSSACHVPGDFLNGFEVSWRCDGKTGLNNINAQVDEGLRHFHFFVQIHTRSGRLLTVPQRGVKDRNGPHIIH